ncbi:hypothetical protein STEG23_020441 [Scotinomys teguina]
MSELLVLSWYQVLRISAICDSRANIQSIRSTDYGTTYEKLNDKVGLKTVLSYLYVNPTNKRKNKKFPKS